MRATHYSHIFFWSTIEVEKKENVALELNPVPAEVKKMLFLTW